MDKEKEKRVFSRIDCELDLMLEKDTATIPVTSRDLSLSGIGLQQPSGIEVGDRVSVALEGFQPVPCSVRWTETRRAGLRFDGSIQTVLDTWVGEVLAAQGLRVADLVERLRN